MLERFACVYRKQIHSSDEYFFLCAFVTLESQLEQPAKKLLTTLDFLGGIFLLLHNVSVPWFKNLLPSATTASTH